MREIKFRLIKDGKIVGYEKHIKPEYIDRIRIFHSIDNVEWIDTAHDPLHEIPHDNKNSCMGSKDKNNKEVYEGDIVGDPESDWHDGIPKFHLHSGIVDWLMYGFWIKYVNHHDGRDISALEEMEVIGNIYENEDLLNE